MQKEEKNVDRGRKKRKRFVAELAFPVVIVAFQSKVALQSFQGGRGTFDLSQATCSLSGRVFNLREEENDYNQ